MLKRVQHDWRVWASCGEIAWPFIRTARTTLRRRPELVSGPMPRWGRQSGWSQSRTNTEAWTLKQVQGDGLWGPSVQHDGRGRDRGALTPARLSLDQTPLDPQISPIRVCLLNQVDLPFPMPILQLLLPRDGVGHAGKGFGVDQPDRTIVRRKAWRRPRAVLVHSHRKVRCNADVKRSAFLAGEDVSAGLSHMSVDTTQRRHAELVSPLVTNVPASMPRFGRQAGCIQSSPNNEAWVLKRVQDDGRYGDCYA
jgi:hypothetical protein